MLENLKKISKIYIHGKRARTNTCCNYIVIFYLVLKSGGINLHTTKFRVDGQPFIKNMR